MTEAVELPPTPHLNLVVLGHSQSGKSTLLGRWMSEIGALCPSETDRMERDGHGNLKYSRVWDALDCEKQRDMTIDIHERSCTTKKYRWTVIDVPGHRRYLKNTLSGLSCADCVLLVLDSSPGTFEAQMEDNSLNAQTKEHLLMLYALGVKQMVVVANKMDACGYKQERFETICQEVKVQMRKLNLNPEETRFVPVSALQGDNIIAPAKSMPWFTGSTLLEALESMVSPVRLLDKPFRLPIQQVQMISGIGTVVVGKIEAGVLEPGATVHVAPCGVTATVKSIEMHQQTVDKGSAGDRVGISLRGVSSKDLSRGMVLTLQEGSGSDKPMIQVVSFQATVSVRRAQGISCGYVAVLDVHSAHVPCRFSRIISKLDKKTGGVAEENPSRLADRDVGSVELVPLCPLFLDGQRDIGPLGRFVMQDVHQIVAFGSVKSVEKCGVKCKPGSLAGRNGNAEASASA